MKLPDDPKVRIKILVLIGIGGVAVIFSIVALVIKPLLAAKRDRIARIADITRKMESANSDVSRMIRERQTHTSVLESLVQTASVDHFILAPRLGNYELGAREFVEAIAQESGVALSKVTEIGITQVPQAPDQKVEHSLKSYGLGVTLKTGLHGLVTFLEKLEARNPYLVVSGLTVEPSTEDRVRHEIRLELQWPIWSDPALTKDLETRLQDARELMQVEPGAETGG